MEATEGLVRGQEVKDTGAPIMVPVGPGTLGRILNVIGEPVDEQGPIEGNAKAPIHRPAPLFTEQGKSQEILVTGIKVVDLLAPYAKGGKIGLFGGAGVGKVGSDTKKTYTYLPCRPQLISSRLICVCFALSASFAPFFLFFVFTHTFSVCVCCCFFHPYYAFRPWSSWS